MSVIDETLSDNKIYAENFNLRDLPIPPARRLAIVACMDARLSIEPMLGLKTGEAHIIRNAGGVVTEDALRSLIISHHLLGTREFMVINHTDCGMMTFTEQELRTRLEEATGKKAERPVHFHSFPNLEDHVRRQLETIRDHPWMPEGLPARGFIYDVHTGRLKEVV